MLSTQTKFQNSCLRMIFYSFEKDLKNIFAFFFTIEGYVLWRLVSYLISVLLAFSVLVAAIRIALVQLFYFSDNINLNDMVKIFLGIISNQKHL